MYASVLLDSTDGIISSVLIALIDTEKEILLSCPTCFHGRPPFSSPSILKVEIPMPSYV